MITLAIDRYDRHVPFFDGTVTLPPGLDLEVLQVGQETPLRDGRHRHEQMLNDGAFDAAEVSLSSYLAARAQGLPFTAVPVFPRRLFSHGQIFINTRAGIETPADLAGKTIGIQSFQTTLAVLAKGDLASDYGVPLDSIRWKLRNPDTVAVAYDGTFDIEMLPDGADLTQLLATGEVDALLYSRTPRPKDPALRDRVRRLFPDPRPEEAKYVARHGYWPAMHLIALKEDAAARHPELPMQLMAAFADAQRFADDYIREPSWTGLAWGKYTLEEEERAFAAPLWTSGIKANRANVERFVGYALDQRLIPRRLALDELFHPSVMGT